MTQVCGRASLDALSGITVAAKIRIEREPQGRPMAHAGRRNNLADRVPEEQEPGPGRPRGVLQFTGLWLMALDGVCRLASGFPGATWFKSMIDRSATSGRLAPYHYSHYSW